MSALLARAASLPYTNITEEPVAVEIETRLSKPRVLPASDSAIAAVMKCMGVSVTMTPSFV